MSESEFQGERRTATTHVVRYTEDDGIYIDPSAELTDLVAEVVAKINDFTRQARAACRRSKQGDLLLTSGVRRTLRRHWSDFTVLASSTMSIGSAPEHWERTGGSDSMPTHQLRVGRGISTFPGDLFDLLQAATFAWLANEHDADVLPLETVKHLERVASRMTSWAQASSDQQERTDQEAAMDATGQNIPRLAESIRKHLATETLDSADEPFPRVDLRQWTRDRNLRESFLAAADRILHEDGHTEGGYRRCRMTPAGLLHAETSGEIPETTVARQVEVRRSMLEVMGNYHARDRFLDWTRLIVEANVTHIEFKRQMPIMVLLGWAKPQTNRDWIPTADGLRALSATVEESEPGRNSDDEASPPIPEPRLRPRGRWAAARNGKTRKGARSICAFLAEKGLVTGEKQLRSLIAERHCPVTSRGQGRAMEADEGELTAWLTEHLDIVELSAGAYDDGGAERAQIDAKTRPRSDRSGKPVTLERDDVEIKPRRADRKRKGK